MTVRDYKTDGPYRVDFTDDGRTWATNAVRFDTVDDATNYARRKTAAWLTCRAARVVTSDTVDRERVDPNDDRIVVDYL